MQFNRLLLGITLLLGSSLPALAVDGVVLINQAAILAGGGFPYKITQPGSYRLSGNLISPVNVDAIDVSASGVAVDLNGFTITGSGTGDGIATIGSIQMVAVRNGALSGYSTAVAFGTCTVCSLQELFIINATTGISVGNNARVRANIIRIAGSAGTGIFAQGTGSLIAANIVSGYSTGMNVQANSTVTGNTIELGSENAVLLYCPSSLTDNTLTALGIGNPYETVGTGCNVSNNATSP